MQAAAVPPVQTLMHLPRHGPQNIIRLPRPIMPLQMLQDCLAAEAEMCFPEQEGRS